MFFYETRMTGAAEILPPASSSSYASPSLGLVFLSLEPEPFAFLGFSPFWRPVAAAWTAGSVIGLNEVGAEKVESDRPYKQ